MTLNKIDEVWNSANPLFAWRFDGIEIYPMDSGIYLLNNWGQSFVVSSLRIPKALHGRDVDIFQDQEIPTLKEFLFESRV